MSEHKSNHPQDQPAGDAAGGTSPWRPARSGEGLDSVISRLREQEDQRVQNNPSGLSGGGN